MKISSNTYELQAKESKSEFLKSLRKDTKKSGSLTMSVTNKHFIGLVSNDSFKVITSLFPVGAVCVIESLPSEQNHVKFKTRINKAFIVLLGLWFMALLAVSIILPLSLDQEFSYSNIIGLLIGLLIFRIFLHGVYIISRNGALNRFKKVMNIKEINEVQQ